MTAPFGAEAVLHLARWLLVAVALDLIVTRFVVRLAILVPKGEPFAAASAILGRIGAATDVLVPILGLLLLSVLLARAGTRRDRLEQGVLVAVAVVAVGGLALVLYPPTPAVVVTLGVLTGTVAILSGIRLGLDRGRPLGARLGLALLSAAVVLAAASHALEPTGLAGLDLDASPSVLGGLTLQVAGQIAFVVGAGLVGVSGVAMGARDSVSARLATLAGAVVAIAVVLAGTVAPLTWSALSIWSVGLTAAVPVPAVALAIGVAVAGLPVLHRRAAFPAIGAGIVLFAGFGLAASGLVFASLLGLVVAAFGGPHQRGERQPAPEFAVPSR